MKKITIITVLALLFTGQAFSQGNTKEVLNLKTGNDMYLTYELSDDVILEPVQYTNRYGVTIAAHLFLPKNMDKSKKYPAVLIGTPYGGVKEQGAGIYGMNLAERGFVAMAFDESFNGESGGYPRDVSSPDFFVEDFSAGVDYLGTCSYVDREKIGVVGICGSGGFSLTAAQIDHRIKAVVTASMYDISDFTRNGLGRYITEEQRDKMIDQLGEQRWKDFENGTPGMPQGGFPDKPAELVPEGLPAVFAEFYEYYGMKRGWHPNIVDNFTLTSSLAFMNFPLLSYVEDISCPVLIIAGENAHSLYWSKEVYERINSSKELMIIPGARHIDLYDGGDKNYIPFDKIELFFKTNLK